MIPKGWELLNLADCIVGKPKYGANASAISYSKGLPRYIRITDIQDDGNLANQIVSLSLDDFHEYILKDNDFVIARSGNTVGKSFLYSEGKHGFAAYAGYLIKFVINPNILLPTYLKFYAQSDRYWIWVRNTIRSGAQPNINAQEYSSLRILVPPLLEQCRIAEVLGVWDESIDLLERLIGKTRSRKQGLMQQLLTGKKRFKEFEGSEWKTIELSKLFTLDLLRE
jgi:type I restriction enzyme, S subunit